MQMRTFRVVAIVSLIFSSWMTLTAQKNSWWVGAHAGREYFNNTSEDMKKGWNTGVVLRYYFSDRIYSLATLNYGFASSLSPSGYFDELGNSPDARFRRHSILPAVELGYEFLQGDFYSCYAQGGVGYGMEYNSVSYPQEYDVSVKRFGWLAELGGDYFLRDNLSLGISVAHLRVGWRNNWTANVKLSICLL